MSVASGMAVGRRDSGRPFQGLRVFLPRNYLPPDNYSALQDALSHQGAEVFLNLNPFANSKVDYHVLADNQVDKIKDMLSKGCRIVGPECVFRCAREFRRFPDCDYTCCLALEDVSVLLTGFSVEEKKELEGLVTSMGGTLQQHTVPDIDFVVAKDVLAAKYKWACRVVRKPVLMPSWLQQCAREHVLVPYDPYRMLPLSGLSICATGLQFDDRFRIQEAAQIYGATYDADLKKECTHLIALLPEGRKYMAAKGWGVRVVSQMWFWESIEQKMCLDEECFPVVAEVPPPTKGTGVVIGGVKQDGTPAHEQAPSSSPPSKNDVSASGERGERPPVDIAADGLPPTDGDAMYLSGCRIYLTGFDASEMRRLVNLVLGGGGTRHVEMNDTITHVILGSLPESGMKDIRQLAMWGAVYIVKPAWLEECTRQRREVSAELYQVPQDRLLQGNEHVVWAAKEKSRMDLGTPAFPDLQHTARESRVEIKVCENVSELPGPKSADASGRLEASTKPLERDEALNRRLEIPTLPPSAKQNVKKQEVESPSEDSVLEKSRSLAPAGPLVGANNVFKGRVFGFRKEYPSEQRADVVRRVMEHGGQWEGDALVAGYVLAPHGSVLAETEGSSMKYVSKNWVSQCMEEGKLLDIQSHILFRPLPCQLPFVEFQGLKFCVSQYSERDRKLLRKLCHLLRVKFNETLNSKITHLLCKVQAGEKFESAERLGIQCVTADWLYACVARNKAVPLDSFRPREPTAAEKEVEHTYMTQRPIRAGQLPPLPSEAQTQKQLNHLNPLPSQDIILFTKSTRTTMRTKVAAERNVRLSQTSAQGLDCSLSSQAQGTSLDPWDASAPSVADSGNNMLGMKPTQEGTAQSKPAIGRSSLRPLTRSMKNGDSLRKPSMVDKSVVGRSKPQALASAVNTSIAQEQDEVVGNVLEEPSGISRVQTVGAVDASAVGNDILDQDGSQEGGGCPPNVADAIEGLLRQTSKGRGASSVEVTEVNQDIISPEPTTLSRRTREDSHTHTDFKKPKLYPTRSCKVEGDPKSPNLTANQEDILRFEESQIDSQMVAYDEDHSERQNLMERVRTRSSTIALSSTTTVGRKTDNSAGAWKGDQKLGRLFKAAEANK